MIVSLLSVFMLVTQQPFGVMSCSRGTIHTVGVALCWHWQSCHGSRDEIPLAFFLRFCILQAIKNWRCRRPRNKASTIPHHLFWKIPYSGGLPSI